MIVVQISDTVYPMYKAYIEPDLKTAHLKIYNTFNPFSGFMDPTYILKSAQRVSKETIHSLLKVTFIPDAANFRFCKFVLCQSAIRAHLVGLSADTKHARALFVQRKVRNQIYALQSWRSGQCPPPCLQCPPPCVQCVHHLACSARAVSTALRAVSTTSVQCPPLSVQFAPPAVQYPPPAAHALVTRLRFCGLDFTQQAFVQPKQGKK